MLTLRGYLKIALIIIFVIVGVLAAVLIDTEKQFDPAVLRAEMQQFGVAGPIIFVLLFIVSGLFFPITPLAIAAGVLFGTLFGAVLVAVASFIGAVVAFWLARYLGKEFMETYLRPFLVRHVKRHAVFKGSEFTRLLMLRLVPILPFNAVNYSLGVSRASTRNYVLATAIGVLPYSFIAAYFGASLATLDVSQIVVAGVLFLLLLLSVPLLRFLRRNESSK